MSNILVIPDPHAMPEVSNERADWLGQLIMDVRPDVVVNMGDCADMPSLCSYDKGTKGFIGRTYQKDIEAAQDFNDRLFYSIRKAKKKLPRRIILEGNHEYRIKKAVNSAPQMEGTMSFKDLGYKDCYDDVVEYDGSTPGTIDVDGVTFAHYMVSGVLGRAISGEHLAYSLITKNHTSCVVGHNHTFDYSVKSAANGKKLHGLCCGVYQEHTSSYAGSQGNNLWWRGVVLLRNTQDGEYDIETISMKSLRETYGH